MVVFGLTSADLMSMFIMDVVVEVLSSSSEGPVTW